MLAVFSLAVHDAAQRGTLAALRLALREVRDLPTAAIRAHRRAMRSTHMSLPTQPHNESERDSWKAALAGAAPLFIFGLNTVAREALPPELWPGGSMNNLFVVYLALLAGLGVGWLKSFPRWSYSYAGFILLFTWYWMGVATPGLVIVGHIFQHDELWGWRAWIAFAMMAMIALLVTRSLRPVKEFFYGAGRDWTRLSSALYGFMPVIVWFCFDEIRRPYAAPYLALTTLALTGGALAYLRSATTSRRLLALLIAVALSGIVSTVGTATYWHGRQEFWMTAPASGLETALAAIIFWTAVAAAMIAPALLGLMRRAVRPT